MRTLCLSVHAAYACQHSGACCTAPWRIPVEPEVVHGIRSRKEIATFLDRGYGEPYVPRREGGACVFFESERERHCAIHRLAGPELMPSACRHFPRVVLRDPRGAFVTLSCFCPTAASMLLEHVPLAIVEAPASLALEGTLEGLDATAVMPPLLRPGVLTDYEGYTAWEHAAIAVLDRDDLTARGAMDAIAEATSRVQRWSPGATSLAEYVAATFADVAAPARATSQRESRPLRMFLAAHLFASWAAYQNGGLSGVVGAVRDALTLVETAIGGGASFVDAVRAADLELRHTETAP